MNILIFGKNSQLGLTLVSEFPKSKISKHIDKIISLSKKDCDLSNSSEIQQKIRKCRPNIIINCAAFTAVDLAESQPDLVNSVNAYPLKAIATAAKKNNSLVIHYSTDYVFDGSKNTSYLETDNPNPINVYGQSKLLGEKYLKSTWPKHIIFRCSWIFSKHQQNFLKTIIAKAQELKTMNIVADQFGAPTSANLISKITIKIIEDYWEYLNNPNKKFNFGLYHLSAKGKTSWYEYAKFIVKNINHKIFPLKLAAIKINPINSIDYPTPAKRPLNSKLDTSLIQKTFNISLPNWQDDVLKVLTEITEEL